MHSSVSAIVAFEHAVFGNDRRLRRLMPARAMAGARTALLTAAALAAFVGNSLLCRVALTDSLIDPTSFATLRLVAGALVLWLIAGATRKPKAVKNGDWTAAAALFVFVIAFSFAYVSLTVGTGALILFGTVQVTMLIAGRRSGERFTRLAWFGFTLAMTGFIYLLSPGLVAPPPAAAVLMAIAGVAWGFYCLRGRAVADPLAASAANFRRAASLAAIAAVPFAGGLHWSWAGSLLAIVSGAGVSGIGFAVWYAALGRLTATRAATVQLTVPVVAAFAGVLLLAEPLTTRLTLASVTILGGIGLVLLHRAPAIPAPIRK